MITEDYVSFEIAKLLKEKGFDEKCHSAWLYNPKKDNSEYFVEYLAKGTENNTELEYFNEKDTDWAYSAPTLQRAMKWLREVHNIHIEVHLDSMDGRHPIYEALYSECVNIRTNNFIDYGDTYEKACEAAIKYCLTNLI